MRALLLGMMLALAWGTAFALDSARWPPPERVQARMHELQAVIRSPDSTRAQREAARAELANLLKSSAGQVPGSAREARPSRPARAAIEPYPSVVKPLPALPPAPLPPAAPRLEAAAPPKPPVVNPQTGSPVVPSGKFAIDPTSGAVLHEVPGGYVDPRTGQFIPR